MTDFINLLSTIETLKKNILKFNNASEDHSYNKLLKNIDALEHYARQHYKELYEIGQTLELAANTKLTDKQRLILTWLKENYQEATVYTNLIDKLSKELDIPKSTVRWNLKGLRESDLIKAGDRENKGIPVELTTQGRIISTYTT
jgi:DNA-binding MarR family transcriptional regulator